MTTLQYDTLKFVIHFLVENGFPPTQKEIADHYGILPKMIQERLERLEEMGFLDLSYEGRGRCIKVRHLKLKPEVV